MANQTFMADEYVEKVEKFEEDDSEMNESIFKMLKAAPIKTAQELIKTCESAMQPRASAWARYRKKYRRGLRYLGQDLSQNPLYATNYIYNVIETLKANLTRQLPAIVAIPEEDGDSVASDILTKMLNKGLEKAKFKTKLKNQVHHAAITGTGWLKVWYDPDAFDGKGDVVIEAIAPEDVLVLPYQLDYTTSSLFIHRVRDMSVDELKAIYKVDKIDGSLSSKLDKDRSLGDVNRKSSIGVTTDLYEVWTKEPESGNWHILTIAGNTVLKELTKSKYKHNKAPFIPWYDNLDVGADQAYVIGVGEVEEIEMLQDHADALDMRIYKNIKQIVSRQKILNPASGINKNDIDDTPSRVYLCTGRPQDAMMWDNPPPLPADVYMYRERIEDRIQIVSGIFDVTQGKKPSGIQAAKAISALQQAAQARIEEKTQSLLEAISAVAELVLQVQLQMYGDERIIRLESGESIKIVGDYPDAIKNGGVIDPMTGEPMETAEDADADAQAALAKAEWKTQNEVDLVLSDINFNYDIRVTTHSALPEDRGERAQLYFDMFRVGAIDRKALLEGLDFPNRTAILERLDQQVTGKTPPELNPDNQAMLEQQQMQEMMAQQMSQNGQGVY